MLRQHDGKDKLTVLDFVGNHRMFLDRIRRLLSLGSSPSSLHAFLESSAPPELPPGRSIDLKLELKELLQTFLPRGALEVERVYRELVLTRGERPTIGELYRIGYHPSTLRKAHGSWFRFVATEGDLDAEETRALDAVTAWLEELEASAMPKSFQLVVLEVLLETDALTTGLPLAALAQRSHAFLQRSPELLRELDDVTGLSNPLAPSPCRVARLLARKSHRRLDPGTRLVRDRRRPLRAPSPRDPRGPRSCNGSPDERARRLPPLPPARANRHDWANTPPI